MTPEKSQIAHLIELAKIDGALDPKEVMLIYGIAQKVGLSKAEMDRIIEGDFDTADSFPDEQTEKVTYFYQLLVLAVVDGDVDEEEYEFLKRMGSKLGLEARKIQDAMDYLIANHKTDLSGETIAELFM